MSIRPKDTYFDSKSFVDYFYSDEVPAFRSAMFNGLNQAWAVIKRKPGTTIEVCVFGEPPKAELRQ